MPQPRLVLVVGFGNLAAKLLPLRWAFPFLRFEVVEQSPDYFCRIRDVFRQAGSVSDLLAQPADSLDSANLRSFRDALLQTPGFDPQAPENAHTYLGRLFDTHVHFDGDPAGYHGDDIDEQRGRYQRLIRLLAEHEPGEVLLYLATHPEAYLDSLKRYAAFAGCVGIDKPLAKSAEALADLRRFVRVNPDLTIVPIDHYLFKLDFTRFLEELDRRGGLDPREVRRVQVTIAEPDLDESREYFRKTGIIRDMLPHVAAMVSLLFRRHAVARPVVGNVLPVVHEYPALDGSRRPATDRVIVQAEIELNYWTGSGYLPVSIRLAKGETDPAALRKEIVVTWHTGQDTRIDLTKKPPPAVAARLPSGGYVDWAGALNYLLRVDLPVLGPMRAHFTFDRACAITEDVLACQQQAEAKVGLDAAAGRTFARYGAGRPDLPRQVFVFNFDGVMVNTEQAHLDAWKTWHRVIGAPEPDLATAPWYEPGRPNREMVSRALTALYQEDRATAGYAVQYADPYYRLFAHILREEKLQLLERALPDGLEEPTGNGPAESPRHYHWTVRRLLGLLRRFNQHLILVTTNDALLVQQTLDRLLDLGPNHPRLGFDRYYVAQRRGVDACREAIAEARVRWGPVGVWVFDDYSYALNELAADCSHRDIPAPTGPTTLVRMNTMHIHPESPPDEVRSLADFDRLYHELERSFTAPDAEPTP